MNDQPQAPLSGTTRHPLEVDGSVELAVLTRSGMAESRHMGAAAVVGPDGALLRSVGDVAASIYPRSCLKPFQALTVLRSGVRLDGVQAVLATASHAGTAEHQGVVRAMLARIDRTEDDLLCPPDWPFDRETARRAVEKRRITMNCSGKHAAFLLACAENGWDHATYDDFDHPLQRAARSTVAEHVGEDIDQTGVDGCGAPVFAVTLRGLARGIARLTGSASTDEDADAGHLVRAVLADPWALDGHGRANTVTIEELGLLAKLGAEGVMVMGTTDGVAVAVKVLDGNIRAGTLAALHLLVDEGVVEREAADRVLDRTLERITGGGVLVGGISAGAGLVA
ncbi:asparaginase [Frondihabitans peucedani]|uniref:Asparaginase n=1 Tax=Frondihabitans peucedani TaxID=598626 RepID=A0ABP8DYN7_9MICO